MRILESKSIVTGTADIATIIRDVRIQQQCGLAESAEREDFVSMATIWRKVMAQT